jgi:hypothetical protein
MSTSQNGGFQGWENYAQEFIEADQDDSDRLNT